MLSYQHVYHAGNNADCHKHLVLSLILQRLKEKDTPFCYRDTHSGRGVYALDAPEIQKLNEYHHGLQKIWDEKNWPTEAQFYRRVLETLNPQGKLAYAPGSPCLAHAMGRTRDRLELYELHPQEHLALTQSMRQFDRITINNQDGWEALTSLAAPKEKRGLVLIDPSYELREDYALMGERLVKALKLWRGGIYAIWFPMLSDRRHRIMVDAIVDAGIRNVLMSTLYFTAQNHDPGMVGSGMIIVNPPWKIEETIKTVCDWLTSLIGHEARLEQVVPE